MGPKNMNFAPSRDNNNLSAKEQYYKDQHDARVAQLSQFRMNNFKETNGENVDRGESDRKLELRHQFDQVKLETDTFLKMQAGLGLMNEKEIREYKDNLNKQEKNALDYMRDGGDGSFAPMENLMKRTLDQISDFEAKIQATPEYQEMEQKKALAKKGLDMIKERRENDANLGVNDFRYKEKVYKMQANLAEKDFLAKAFSAEDKKNSNAAAEAKMNEIKNADKKEIAFDFAQNQYKKIQKGEQMSGVEGSFLSKFNVLTGEDTIEKFEPTVKDKIGEVAAKITDAEEASEKNKVEDKIEEVAENESEQTVEFPPAIVPGEESKSENQLESTKDKKDEVDFGGISAEKIAEMERTGGPVLLDADNQIWMQKLPKDQLEQLQKMLPKDQLEQLQKILENQKNGTSKAEVVDSNKEEVEEPGEKSETKESDTEDADIESSEKENSETEKKKGIVAGVIEKIKKHSEGIKRFALIAGIGALVALAAHGGNKFNANNTAVEKSMDNNGDTDGNVGEALAEHDTGSEVDSLIKGNSFNIMVDGNETKIELNDNINPEFPGFTDSRRSGNDMTFVDRSGLESLKEQGASSEALGAEGMKEILNTMENPNMASYLGASFGAFEMADSPTAVNDITYMIQHGDAEAQVAIKEKANNTIANFLEGSTLKLGSIMNETYQSGYASNNGGEGNLQVDMALDKDGVFHKDQAVEFVYAENKDGENIMDMNVRDGFKENSG